jgi:hypothetical protein
MKSGKKVVPYVRSPFNSFPGSVKSPMLLAGLLTRSGGPAFPFRYIAEQWQKSGQPGMELTAAGTVPGFHGIPF